MRKQLFLSCALCCAMMASAETIDVTTFRYAGPYTVQTPFMVDSVDVNSKTFAVNSLLDAPLSMDVLQQATPFSGTVLPGSESGHALHLVSFTLENTRYATARLQVEGLKNYRIYVDGKKHEAAELTLEPATHDIAIKYLSEPGQPDSLKVSIDTEKEGILALRDDNKRIYTHSDVLHGTHFTRVEVSPNGKYLIVGYRTIREGGYASVWARLTELATGKVLAERTENIRWMPRSNRYYYVREGIKGKELVTVDPATGAEDIMASGLPDGYFLFSPAEDYLLFYQVQEGPKERKEIYEVLEPYDRQPGWRNRSYISKFDLKTGLLQQLTFGFRNVGITDISADGRYMLLLTTTSRLTERPTRLFSLYRLDVHTMQTELLVDNDGFFNNARFSPDGQQILISASPEALGGIGKNVKEGQTPSMTDIQLYLMNIADKKVTPLTKYFNPSVLNAKWNVADGQVYFTAANRDYFSLYRLNPKSGDIRQLNVPEDLVTSFSLAQNAPVMACYGQSASNSDRLYTLNTKNLKTTLIEDLSKDILHGIELGACKEWNFTSSRGDTIYGRYYLPPHFDAAKKYPMIVNYYGGCSPVSRNFESRYPHHAYAALGYVVYVIEPSGATGFGQEFSARHVNTAGEGVAQDIIEGTKQFVKEHAFVNDKKIGCIGASYGGFMTQYLQTKTDIFAAAISHAGISDHTSYWGEGYWGYSYSEVSMANSYPWTDKELFVERSPLFNADKIHTPILFLHGSVDNNVPVGESIQMFTALKLLGRETALVVVDGQDHHILDYGKCIQWQNTIFAWFSKWLQDDAAWWEAIYKPKSL